MVTGRALAWVSIVVLLGACGSNFNVVGGEEVAAGGGDSSSITKRSGSTLASTRSDKTVTTTEATRSPSEIATGGGGNTPSSSTTPGGSTARGGAPAVGGAITEAPSAYPGHGFVVHEWGTDTVVVGSDGSLQRGLHHEEEDLPAFVYDRVKAAALLGMQSPSVTIKMETPVTYFYSDVARTVQASVGFPRGILTQWYPGVQTFSPPIAAPGAVLQVSPLAYADPVLDMSFEFKSDMCRQKYSALSGGKLDWGKVSILARDTDLRAKMPDAALTKFSWSYARAVDSNPVQLPGGETEQFLFYRGLGDFDLPVTVKATAEAELTLINGYADAIGAVFMIKVDEERGAFDTYSQGIAAHGTLNERAPSLAGAKPLDAFAEDLGAAVTTALDGTGLYHDESVAMVNTWKRQWFRTPGTRLLYVVPQRWTDESIPLTITPKPDAMLRVMLIRVEVITPEQEAADVAAIANFDLEPALAREHFQTLGRFAEPRLRRALSLQDSNAGQRYLAEIRTANSAVASGE